MRWRTGRRSTNIEDRRGSRRSPRGIKLGGGTIILILIGSLLFNQNPLELLGYLEGGAMMAETPAERKLISPEEDAAADFVAVILADTEDTWSQIFAASNLRYQPPKLVLYFDIVHSACGMNTAATGPFYCPGDRKVYFDLSFINELQRFGAHGDFSVAYVIAHEVAHHVQNLEGTSDRIRQLQMRLNQKDANTLSVLMELQADCYAGVWAHHAHQQRNILEQGDIEEGLNAAASVGDDRMLRMAGRSVNPDAFTHGSSVQRAEWFQKGLETGSVNSCDTFSQANLK